MLVKFLPSSSGKVDSIEDHLQYRIAHNGPDQMAQDTNDYFLTSVMAGNSTIFHSQLNFNKMFPCVIYWYILQNIEKLGEKSCYASCLCEGKSDINFLKLSIPNDTNTLNITEIISCWTALIK